MVTTRAVRVFKTKVRSAGNLRRLINDKCSTEAEIVSWRVVRLLHDPSAFSQFSSCTPARSLIAASSSVLLSAYQSLCTGDDVATYVEGAQAGERQCIDGFWCGGSRVIVVAVMMVLVLCGSRPGRTIPAGGGQNVSTMLLRGDFYIRGVHTARQSR